jgi:hypothetical protein
MKPSSIYHRIKHITEAQLGRPITPHMFRDAAATFISEMAPERALMAASVLQHRSFRTGLSSATLFFRIQQTEFALLMRSQNETAY